MIDPWRRLTARGGLVPEGVAPRVVALFVALGIIAVVALVAPSDARATDGWGAPTSTPTEDGSQGQPTATPTVTQTSTPTSTGTGQTSTPTPTGTGRTSTPTPTGTRHGTATSTPTSTATVHAHAAFALGIRLDRGDPVTLAAWNTHALTTDAEHSQGANAALLLSAVGTDRSVTCGGAAVLADQCARAIAFAVAGHISDLNVNDEGPPCATLQSDEATVYALAKAAHLTMTWTPTGTSLRACPPSSFVANTDRIIFQTEIMEQDPSINYAQTVHAEIAALHAVRPSLPIAVQVSVNPPHNRTATAAQTLVDIAALEDGSAQAPTRIDVFYYARTRDPSRADVMLAVVAALRP